MAGLRQLDQGAAVSVDAVKPQFRAKDLLIPVGLRSFEHDRIAIRGHFQCAEADGVEKFIDADFRLCLLRKKQSRSQK